MPKYFCDYCDTYLTHDSPSVRKTHCAGRKHRENVKFYYEKWYEQNMQKLQMHGPPIPPPSSFPSLDFPPPPRGLPTGPPPPMPSLANVMLPPPTMLPLPHQLAMGNVMIPPPTSLLQPPPSMPAIVPPGLQQMLPPMVTKREPSHYG